MQELILDSHKLAWHLERVQQWEMGEKIAPIGVDMALTRACGAMCKFCYAMVQESQARSSLKWHQAKYLIDDFAALGVKSVSLVSDGESTLSPHFVDFINYGKSKSLDMACATNGWEFTPTKIDECLDSLTWVRFTVAAGTPSGYSEIMYKGPHYTGVFDRAMGHIRHAVEVKRSRKLNVTLGIQMVLMPGMESEIIPFAKLGLSLGVDYAVIKHCSDDEGSSLGIDYSKYKQMFPVLREAEAMSNSTTSIIVKWNKILDGGDTPYKRFYGPQFLLQISGSGLVAPSGMFFNAKYSKFHIGNYTDSRFIDMFNSGTYWDVMHYLASPYFDARTMMGTLPIQYYISKALNDHVTDQVRIVRPDPFSRPPLHVNFL
jgi:MoaA/NifB/PqqE/SkfB family radical SAM enzyme